jgi:hypothetical protein
MPLRAEEPGITARMPALKQPICLASGERPGATVASVVLRLATFLGSEGTPEHAYSVIMRIKGRKKPVWMGGNCRPEGEEMRCGIDCDGGELQLGADAADPRGLLLRVRDHARMGDCGEGGIVILRGSDFPEPAAMRAAADKVCTAAERRVKEARRYVGAVMELPKPAGTRR